ncbi:MAG TPA: TonB-dependent receptor [Bacteroidia bacterium]|nr:TonB-dependent receptor [Bacteroidia bacterium]
MRSTGLFITYFLFFSSVVFSQRQYAFNSPGNECYMRYICFTKDGNYSALKKPIVFQLGKPGETAQQGFDDDTLKNIEQFSNYMFVYIPNMGGTAKGKLYCINSLAEYLTFNFSQGYTNLFFQIKDESITKEDLSDFKLNSIFKSIKIESSAKPEQIAVNQNVNDSIKPAANKTIIDDFKSEVVLEVSKYGKPILPPYNGPAKTYNFTLSGKLVDVNSVEALPFATIGIKGKPVGTTTNADGQFTILKVPTDTSTLVISYLGYKKTEFKLTPLLKKSNLIIEVEPLSTQLSEVTIEVEKEDLMNIAGENLGVIKMSPAKLNQLPNIGEKDIMRSFQLMPGVSASNESSSGLYVRGGTPDQNLVVYDGFTVYQVDHLYGFYSAFNSNAIKDVQLYKGGFESKFGGRLSSVTEITGKDGNQNNFNIGGDLSLLSVNAFVETPIGKKMTFLVAGRRSFQGPLYNKIFEQYNSNQGSQQQSSGSGRKSSTSNTVKSYFYDLNSKLTFRPTENDIISVSVYNGTDKLDNSRIFSPRSGSSTVSTFSAKIIDLTKYGNLGGSIKWARKFNSRIYGNTLISYSNFYSQRERSNEFTVTDVNGAESTRKFGTFENNNLKDYSVKTDYTIDITDNNQIGIGGWGTYYDIAYNYSQNDTSTILNRHNFGVLTGAYLQDKIKLLHGKIIVTPGIRASYYSPTKQNYYEPRFFASYNITKKLAIKASTGRFYQFANQVTREDILNGNKTFWVLSDGINVPVSQAIHYIAGVSYDTRNYLFSIEGWYKDLSGLTEHSLRFNRGPTQSYTENFYKGIGYSQGLEFLAQKKFGTFSGWISYTMSKTRSKFDIYSPTYYAANQDVPNEFKIVGIYKWRKFVFSTTWIYATGRPYTAPSGAYNLTLLDGSTQNYFTVSSKNSLRLPDYHRLDIAATYMFKNDKGREFGSLGVSIFNVYNRKNTWYKEFQISDQQIIESNIQYLGFTPNLTLSLKLH